MSRAATTRTTSATPVKQITLGEPAVAPKPAPAFRLPGEGTLYDPLGLSNFADAETASVGFNLTRTFRTDIFSRIVNADLPATITFGAKLLGAKKPYFNLIGRLTFSVRLLKLGDSSDYRKAGFVKYKYTTRTDNRVDLGFEIDRLSPIGNLKNTTMYGNVQYRTNNVSNKWTTHSSFGINQRMRLLGFKFTARVGFTPEGQLAWKIF